jgi:hypothetical protein
MQRAVTKSQQIYFIVVSLILALALPADSVIKDADLSVHYGFEEGTGNVVKDDSPNGNDADIIGKAGWEDGPPGLGKAIIFDGKTDVDMRGKSFKKKPKDAVSLCVWVKHNGAGAAQSLFDVISDVVGAQGLYHVEIRPGGFRWFHRNTADTTIFNINPGPVLPSDEWIHFTGTYDGKSGKVVTYVDGKQTHEAKGDGDLAQNWNQRAGIGHHVQVRWLSGSIDEFYMFTRALTASEVKGVMDGKFLSVQPKDRLTTKWAKIKTE